MTSTRLSSRGAQVRPVLGARVDRQIRRLLALVALADALVIAAAIVLAWMLRLHLDVAVWTVDSRPEEALSTTVGPWILVVWMVVITAEGGYAVRKFASGAEETKALLRGSMLAAGLVGLVCYLLKFDLSRGFLVLTFLIGVPLLVVERALVRLAVHHARLKGRLLYRVVAVGGPASVSELVDVLHRERRAGYQVIGACHPPEPTSEDVEHTVPHLGQIDDMRRICEQVGADAVLVTRGGYSSADELRKIAWDLEGSDIDLIVVPSLTDVAGPRVHMRPVSAGLPLLHLEEPQASRAGRWPKRTFDIVGAALTLAVLSPVMLALAAAIKLSDGGPVLFRQSRVGLRGAEFDCLKFRSMRVNAEQDELMLRVEVNHDGALFKLPADPRVTRLGRLMRRYSLDELPQLLNVLTGSMSLVGPRPQQRWEVDTYSDSNRRRLLVRPGMTGLWQVSGRSTLNWEQAVRLDLYYVDNWSMVADIGIMLRTVRAVLGSRGAY